MCHDAVDRLRWFTQVEHQQTTTVGTDNEGGTIGEQVHGRQGLTGRYRLYHFVGDDIVADDVCIKSDRDEQHLIAWGEGESGARCGVSACIDVVTT